MFEGSGGREKGGASRPNFDIQPTAAVCYRLYRQRRASDAGCGREADKKPKPVQNQDASQFELFVSSDAALFVCACFLIFKVNGAHFTYWPRDQCLTSTH
jgi:hypothetical protein